MATKKPRYMISVDDDMFNAIEDFRFEHRFQTRSEATAELIRLGLEQLKKENETKKAWNEIFWSEFAFLKNMSVDIWQKKIRCLKITS